MRLFSFLASLLLCNLAFAEGPIWEHQFDPNVPPGQKAKLTLRPQNQVHEMSLSLTEEKSGKTVNFKAKVLKAGESKTYSWDVPKGISNWRGELTGSADGATSTAPIEFRILSLGPLEIRIDKADIDLDRGQLLLTSDRPLQQVEAIAFDQNGQKALDGPVSFSEREDGKILVELNPPKDAQLRMIKLKFTDELGYWFAENIASWQVEVAHEEVVFESGKADIHPAERPKLDRSVQSIQQTLANINKELRRYEEALGVRSGVEWRLYVAGYTDTVGQDQDNLALSLKRAEAISRYFKQHGVPVPISYQGFGEKGLAVETPDNTDEIRNRRALYVLGSSMPSGKSFPAQNWKNLK